MTVLSIAVVLLWLLVVALVVLVVLLYRQFGLIYIGSRGRLALTGLAVGSKAPEASLRVAGESFKWDWSLREPRRATVAIFGQSACSLCSKLTPQLNAFMDRWSDLVDVIFIERGPLPGGPTHDVLERRGWTYAEDADGQLHAAFDIEATPYAFVIDGSHRVLGKGIVNDAPGLELIVGQALADSGAEAAPRMLNGHPRAGIGDQAPVTADTTA